MKDSDVDTCGQDGAPIGSTASSLLKGLRGQAPGAWDRLFGLYSPVVYHWACRAGLQSADAADVVQEVFRSVVTNLPGFRRERPGDSFRGWLWTITQNKIRDLHRRGIHRVEAVGGTDAQQILMQVPQDSSSGSGDAFRTSGDPRLIHALGQIRLEFEDRTWRAFWGVVVEGRTAADVAAALGMSANAVYVARSRILRRLRDELGEPPNSQ
jgi:RNA polymerase sigma-70 factor (ECF subfamily)